MNTEWMAGAGQLQVEATRWRTQLQDAPADPALALRLDAWLAQSTAHRLAYAEVADLEYLLQQLPAAEEHAVLRSVPMVAHHRPRRAIWHAVRVLVAVLLLAWGWLNLPGAWQNWRADQYTTVGEIGRVVLADGSILLLDSDSAVRLQMDQGQRVVELWRGTAYVQVVPDPARPFVVRAAGVTATALGTAYSVESDSGRVAVEHGRVRVAGAGLGPLELGAGQSAQPSATGWQQGAVSTEAAPDWTRGHRSFAQRPFREVLTAIDRYLPGRIWLRATVPLDEPVTAVFDLADPQLALEQLCAAHGLQVQFWPGLIVIEAQ